MVLKDPVPFSPGGPAVRILFAPAGSQRTIIRRRPAAAALALSDAAIANAVQMPVNDPLLLIPAMAYVTRNLGFGVTCAVSYEHPYMLARRFSTLDHLTGGRIGWNVVTGYLNSAAKGVGLAGQPEHDTRYEIAEEYMQIVYKLWEGSWEDGAVLRDRHPGGHR